MILKRDQLFRVVCSILTPTTAGKAKIGTGSFISTNNKVYLLTAQHISCDTNDTTILALGDAQSNCMTVPLKDLVQGNVWKSHPKADMAIIEINISLRPDIFTNRCYPIDHINLTNNPASRDDELTVIGFPQGLGIRGKFSPLTFRSYASSSILTLNRFDTHTPSDFFCLENPSVGGYSGGPVFDLGYQIMGALTTQKEKTIMHGIVHGTMTDDTGGKIALITPMYYLNDII